MGREIFRVFRGGKGMQDSLLLTTMVLAFAGMLGKLAYDEWRSKRARRNP